MDEEAHETQEAASHLRVVPAPATRRNQRWSVDFVRDTHVDGRRFRVPTIVDQSTRECVAPQGDFSLTGKWIPVVLNAPKSQAEAVRCQPEQDPGSRSLANLPLASEWLETASAA